MLQAGPSRRPGSGASQGQREAPGSKPGSAQSQRSNSSADGMQLVAAEYVLDFGHVIKGTQKARASLFRYKNCSAHVLASTLWPAMLAEVVSQAHVASVMFSESCCIRLCVTC